jgi:hypothetical protein
MKPADEHLITARIMRIIFSYRQESNSYATLVIADSGHASKSTHSLLLLGWSSHPCSSHGSPFSTGSIFSTFFYF